MGVGSTALSVVVSISSSTTHYGKVVAIDCLYYKPGTHNKRHLCFINDAIKQMYTPPQTGAKQQSKQDKLPTTLNHSLLNISLYLATACICIVFTCPANPGS